MDKEFNYSSEEYTGIRVNIECNNILAKLSSISPEGVTQVLQQYRVPPESIIEYRSPGPQGRSMGPSPIDGLQKHKNAILKSLVGLNLLELNIQFDL